MIKTHLRNQFKPNLEEIALYIGSFTEGLLDGFIAISIPVFVGLYLKMILVSPNLLSVASYYPLGQSLIVYCCR